jgi:ABC-type bacteriocin/lantibiotic exporter with double-glycine peptidase domain
MNFIKMIAQLWQAFCYSLRFCWRNDAIGTSLLFVLAALLSGSGFIVTLVASKLTDQVQFYWSTVGSGDVPPPVMVWVMVLAVVIMVSAILGVCNWFVQSRWQQIMWFANRRELDEHYATLDVARIRSKAFDDLQRRIDELPTGWGVRIELMRGFLSIFGALVSFLSFGLALVFMEPLYGVILIATMIPLMVFQFKDTARWWQLTQELMPVHKARSILERPYKTFTTFLQAKVFNQFPFLRIGIDQNVDGILQTYADVRKRSLILGVVTQTIAVVGSGIVIMMAVQATWRGAGTVGTLVLVIPAVRVMAGNLEQVIELLAEQWQSVQAVLLIEGEYLQLKPLSVFEGYDTVGLSNTAPAVSFRDVEFAYPNSPERLVLEGVSFNIPKGAKVAIVGENGSGKSTLMSLLLRHYAAKSGSVELSGVSVTDMSTSRHTSLVTALTQDYEVLPRTLRQEIASARLGDIVDESRIYSAINCADLDRVLTECDDGIDTKIGVEFGGRDFSGGQRQRIALARTIYALDKTTQILLLDEAEAKLDPESAERVIFNILALSEVTVLMVTHFAARARDFDLVLVMDGGKLVEFGNPHEIMQQQGVFTRLLAADTKRRGGE